MLDIKQTQEGSIEINDDLSDAMAAVSSIMHEGLLENLGQGGSPTWKTLSGGGNSYLGGRGGSIAGSLWHSNTENTATAGGGGLPYSYIHNYGGFIPVTERSRNFFYAKFKETGKRAWFAMFLKYKPGDRIEMPKREYVTFTPNMVKKIRTALLNHVVILTKDGKKLNV